MFYRNTLNLSLNPSLTVLSQICKFWAVNCTKMRLAGGGSYSALPDHLAVIRGTGLREGEGNG